MKRFKKLLVLLPDDESTESNLLEWAALLASASEADGVDLIKTLAPSLSEFPAKSEEADETKRLDTLVAEQLSGHPTTVTLHEGSPISPTLQKLSSGEYDLLLTSANDHENRSIAERLARKSPVGVLILPENPIAAVPPRHILTGVDFADLSALALDWSEAFATLDSSNESTLTALHVVSVPDSVRANMAMPPGAMRKHVSDSAADSLELFLKREARDQSQWERRIDLSHFPGTRLAQLAHPSEYDLLVIGCQGRNALSVALLGSHAAEVIRSAGVPLLVVKRKNESLKVLRTLLGQN